MNSNTIRNAWFDILGEGIWGLQAGMIPPATVLAVLLARYGADNTVLGLISAIQGGLMYLPQVIGLFIFHSMRYRKRQAIAWHIFGIIPVQTCCGLVILLDGHISPAGMQAWLLGLHALLFIFCGVIIGVWSEWLAHLFHIRIRATVMGAAFCLYSILGTLGGLGAGWMIERMEGTRPYAILFIASGLIAWVSMACFMLIDDPAGCEPDLQQQPTIRGVLSRFHASLSDWNFRAFLIGRIMVSVGLCVSPFLAAYYQSPEGGSLSDGIIVTCGAAMTIGTAISTILIGCLGDRTGHRSGIIAGAMLQVVTLAILLFTRGTVSCALAYLGIGICVGFAFISHTNMLLETCPHDDRLAHITVGNTVMTVPLLAAPLLAGYLANQWGLRPMFLLSLAVSALAAIWFIACVKEPRTATPAHAR